MLQVMSDAGLAPTPQNMQRVRQLMNSGGGEDTASGDAGAGSRTLNRIGGGTTSPAPVARPRAKQGNQAGQNSHGPAALPTNSESPTSLTAPYDMSLGADDGSAPAPQEAPVAPASEAPQPAGLKSNITMQDVATALGLTAGAGGLAYATKKIIGKPSRFAVPGDIVPSTDEMLQPPVQDRMQAEDIGVDPNAGSEMAANIKPNVPAEMQPGDIAEATMQRMMGGGDLGVNGPKSTPNLSLEQLLGGTNRQINEGMTVVPSARNAADANAPGPGSDAGSPIGDAVPTEQLPGEASMGVDPAPQVKPTVKPQGLDSGKIMPDNPLPSWMSEFGGPSGNVPEASMGTDLNATDQGNVAARAKSENDARVKQSVEIEKGFDKAGLLDGLRNAGDDPKKLQALERQWSTKDFEAATKILERNKIVEQGAIKNSAQLVKALRTIAKALR